MHFGRLYQHYFDTKPWATLMATNGSLTLFADSLAQTYEHKKSSGAGAATSAPWDWHRSGRFLVFGTAVAPLLAEWNKFLEYRFSIRSSTGKMLYGGLARRVLTDQLLFAPLGVGLFVGAMGVMEGRRSWPALKEKFSDMYVPALLANWTVWPLLQMFNFGVLPLRLRVPFSASCGVAWTLYLSILNQKDVEE